MTLVRALELDPKYAPLAYDRITTASYPYDYYGIHFYYDKSADAENCMFTIQGKYHDLVKVANDFYANEKEFKSETYKPANIEIGTKYTFREPFSQCFKQIVNFLNIFVEVIEEEKKQMEKYRVEGWD